MSFLRSRFAQAVLVLVVAMGVYHLGAILDAFRLGRRLTAGSTASPAGE